ncbi:MAG: amidohydrolase family protein [Gemmatimonadetes bacterium]|nr:amidohydrolase family protein [Gemmatimonadota bacterium]
MTLRVYHARWVLPISGPAIADGAVAVEGAKISWVGRAIDAPPGLRVDLGASILMPGLVNVHAHLELTAMRGYLEDLDFRPWILRLTRSREHVMTPERRRAAACAGIAEGLLAGITTYADVSDSGESLPAMRDMGVRGVMFREVFGPHPVQAGEAVAGLRSEVERWGAQATPRVSVGVSPHAPYTVSDALFAETAALARALDVPLTVHIAESEAEQALVVEGNGVFADAWRARGIEVVPRSSSPIALLQALGVLETRALLVHAVRASASDLELVRASGAGIAHCPASNAKLGHGTAPLLDMIAAGIPVGLGSDSVASSNRMDLLDDARLAVFQQRALTGRAAVPTASALLHMVTRGGAEALGLAATIGTLEPGKAADLVSFAADPVRDGPGFRPEDTLVFGAAGRRAQMVAVDGVELVRGGVLVRDIRSDLAVVADTGQALSRLN